MLGSGNSLVSFFVGFFFSFFLVTFSSFLFLSKFLYIYTMLTFMIDKILNYKTYIDRMKIDALLEIDCNNYANLGIDSTKAEKLEVKKQSRQIYRAIKNY